MKKFLLPLLMISSSAFASVDFNLNKVSEGGNADSLAFTEDKVLANPEKYIGKEVIATVSHCNIKKLNGLNLKRDKIEFEGVYCSASNTFIGLVLDLKQREMASSGEIKRIQGKIVAVSDSTLHSIIIMPEKIN
ncbi:hypothetical protein [Fluviispira vulneris]|uniref:hypothetical protein n=1 Tax=Fluviispira vulneris TaxID=2763012 RepID=UPI0016495CEB|nr:hypothetical protein [Fluviispira vulneris]